MSLAIRAGSIPLISSREDTVPFERTYRVSGKAKTGDDLSARADGLEPAAESDSVVVRGVKAFTLTLKAGADIFRFAPLPGGHCRTSAADSPPCATPLNAGKPVGDVYVRASNGRTLRWAQLPKSSQPGLLLADDDGSGEVFRAQIDFRSAWFYETDLPGYYAVTLVYTLSTK